MEIIDEYYFILINQKRELFQTLSLTYYRL